MNNLFKESAGEIALRLIGIVEDVFDDILPLALTPEGSSDSGIYFCCHRTIKQIERGSEPLWGLALGATDSYKHRVYETSSMNGASQLGQHPEHISLLTSRPASPTYITSAIRVRGNGILACSGFQGDCCELFLLMIAEKCDLLDQDGINAIINISQNQVARDHFDTKWSAIR